MRVGETDDQVEAALLLQHLAHALARERDVDGLGEVVGGVVLDPAAPQLDGRSAHRRLDAPRRAQEEIIAAVSHAIAASSRPLPRQVGRPSFARARIIAKVLALTEASAGAPLLTDDLCRAAGVAERTLRNIFHEYFGVGPVRFLKVHQLRKIRAALLAANPARDTVTRIAMRFGISDLSLFSYNYKALFGESPSHSLRIASRRTQRPLNARDPWLHLVIRARSADNATRSL